MRTLIVCAVRALGTEALVAEAAVRHELCIGADGGARTLMDASVTPDLVVGDEDSLSTDDAHTLRRDGVPFEVHPREKGETDLDLALRAARARGATAVTVVGATGRRLDQTLATVGTLSRALDLLPEIVDPGLHGWFLDATLRPRLDLEVIGAQVSVQALSDGAHVQSVGLRWSLDGLVLPAFGSVGVSNYLIHDSAAIVVISGIALVTSCGVGPGITLAREANR